MSLSINVQTNADRARASLTNMRSAILSSAQAARINLSPALEQTNSTIDSVISSIRDLQNTTDNVQSSIDDLQDSINGLSESQNETENTTKSLTLAMVAANLATSALTKIVNIVADTGREAAQSSIKFEQYRVAFETMLKSASKANALLAEIEQFAASTPFQLDTLVVGSKRLLAFGISQKDVIETMRNLGNAAGGQADILDRLTLAFGKVRAKGRASLEELNMFTEAGVPILAELQKQYGVTQDEMFKLISAGKVGFEDVNAAIKGLTTGTGQFAGLIEKQSLTLGGLISTAKDNVGLLAKDLFNLLVPSLKNANISIIETASNVREFVNSLAFQEKAQKALAFLTVFSENIKVAFGEGFNAAIGSIKQLFKEFSGLFSGIEEGRVQAIALTAAFNIISFAVKSSGNAIALVVGLFTETFKLFKEIGTAITSIFKTQAESIKNFVTGIIESGKAIGLAIKGLFDPKAREESKKIWSDAKESFDNFGKSVSKNAPNTFKALDDAVKTSGKAITNFTINSGNKLFEFGKASAEDLISLFDFSNNKILENQTKFLENYKKSITNISSNAPDDLAGLPPKEKLVDWLAAWQSVADGAANGFKEASSSIKTDFGGLAGDIGKTSSSILKNISGLFEKITAESASLSDKITAGITAGLQAVSSGVELAFNMIAGSYEKQLQQLEQAHQKELEQFNNKEDNKLVLAQEKLAEQMAVLEELEQSQDNKRLLELEQYKSHITELTDEDINRALQLKEMEILKEQEDAKKQQINKVAAAKNRVDEIQKEKKQNEEKKRLEEEYQQKKNEIQKKAFEAEKAGNIAKVWITAALGIVAAWASSMQLGPIAGPILASILTATIAGVAAAQTAAIATQTFPGFQSGVTNFSGGAAIVGERGPEMVTLGRGSNVVTNENTNKIISAMNRRVADEENNINYITDLTVIIDNEVAEQMRIENRRFATARIGVV